jgi:hypothetical protein
MPGPDQSPRLAPDQWRVTPPDPRAADVQGVTQLLATAAAEGAAKLPMLSAAELYALCGARQVLTEHDEQQRWAALTEEGRAQLAAAATSFLLDRELLRRLEQDSSAQDGNGAAGPADGLIAAHGTQVMDLPMAPPLALIITARQCPVVVAAGTRPDGSTTGTPRMYGLGENGRPLRAVVVEMVTGRAHKLLGPLHEFVLMSPAMAGQALAAWAATPPRAGLRRQPHDRTVSVYRHQPGSGLSRDRLTVTATGPGNMTAVREPAGSATPVPVTGGRAALAALLTGMLTGEQP